MTGMAAAWWDARTMREGRVRLDERDHEGLEWVRFRLADEINRRYWKHTGIRVLPVFFGPMDGDLYSHPVLRMHCRQAVRTFGRLSRGRVALDAMPYEDEFPWPGGPPEEDGWPYAGRHFGSWEQFAAEAVQALRLDDATAGDHESCLHNRLDDKAAQVYLLALLVRTRLGSAIRTGRQMAERTLGSDDFQVGRTRDAAVRAHPDNGPLIDAEAAWLVIADSASGNALAFRHDGLVATPRGPLDVGRALERKDTPLTIASRLQRALIPLRGELADHPSSLETSPHLLPINRKERFYTATVLPALISHDAFTYLGSFLDLCVLEPVPLVDPKPDDVQLLTEYSLAEAVVVEADRHRFGKALTKESPDLLLWIPQSATLLCVEAKMYHRPGTASLARQLELQRQLLQRMSDGLQPRPEVVRRVLLVAEPYLNELGDALPADVLILTWEQVLDQYREHGPRYWIDVLDEALAWWSTLVGTNWGPGTSHDRELLGWQLAQAASSGELTGWWLGRQGGVTGFQQDVADKSWSTRKYPLREQAPDNPKNWLTVLQTVALTSSKS